jgi:hypothetical protein
VCAVLGLQDEAIFDEDEVMLFETSGCAQQG